MFCKEDDCPWKVTYRSSGDANVGHIHTFNNIHDNSMNNLSLNDHELKAKHITILIDDGFFIPSSLKFERKYKK